jgi:predicted DNA-binding transcriptional regulator AlpA
MPTVRAAREDLTRRGIAPDGLSLPEAAAFIGLSVNTFLREVEAGTLPPPLPLKSRRRIWSRAALARASATDDTPPEVDLTDEIDKAIDEYAA